MKTIFLLPLFLLLLSCEQEGELTRDRTSALVDEQNSLLISEGQFAPTSGISASGKVKIYLENNQYKLKLDNFSVSDGPDLKVYLSKSNTPNEFVNLGNLNAATVYVIPATVAINEYSHVLIHCQQYNHLFAVAQLIKI